MIEGIRKDRSKAQASARTRVRPDTQIVIEGIRKDRSKAQASARTRVRPDSDRRHQKGQK